MPRTLLAACLLLLAACDDPAPVGVDLVDEQSGTPFVLNLSSSDPTPSPVAETTGNTGRALFGTVSDPDFGSTEAVAYLDFVSPGVFSTVFENNPIDKASLLLFTNYVYGDSLADVTVRLRSVDFEWNGTGVTADTVLFVGDVITESAQNYRTRTLEIPLPESWVTQWNDTFHGDSFADDFHGFEISTDGGNAVFGAEVLGSAIRTIVREDTTLFAAGRSLTRFIEPVAPGQTPAGLLFQDGQQAAAAFLPVLSGNAADVVLNRGILRVPIDSTLSMEAPTGFARPVIRQMQLDWISSDGSRLPIALSTLVGSNFEFESVQLHDSLSVFLQGESHLDRLELRVPDAQNGISVLRLPGAPTLHLAVTPFR